MNQVFSGKLFDLLQFVMAGDSFRDKERGEENVRFRSFVLSSLQIRTQLHTTLGENSMDPISGKVNLANVLSHLHKHPS